MEDPVTLSGGVPYMDEPGHPATDGVKTLEVQHGPPDHTLNVVPTGTPEEKIATLEKKVEWFRTYYRNQARLANIDTYQDYAVLEGVVARQRAQLRSLNKAMERSRRREKALRARLTPHPVAVHGRRVFHGHVVPGVNAMLAWEKRTETAIVAKARSLLKRS